MGGCLAGLSKFTRYDGEKNTLANQIPKEEYYLGKPKYLETSSTNLTIKKHHGTQKTDDENELKDPTNFKAAPELTFTAKDAPRKEVDKEKPLKIEFTDENGLSENQIGNVYARPKQRYSPSPVPGGREKQILVDEPVSGRVPVKKKRKTSKSDVKNSEEEQPLKQITSEIENGQQEKKQCVVTDAQVKQQAKKKTEGPSSDEADTQVDQHRKAATTGTGVKQTEKEQLEKEKIDAINKIKVLENKYKERQLAIGEVKQLEKGWPIKERFVAESKFKKPEDSNDKKKRMPSEVGDKWPKESVNQDQLAAEVKARQPEKEELKGKSQTLGKVEKAMLKEEKEMKDRLVGEKISKKQEDLTALFISDVQQLREQKSERQVLEANMIEEERSRELQAAETERLEEEKKLADARRIEEEREKWLQAAEAKRLEEERRVSEAKKIEKEREKELQTPKSERIEKEQQAAALKRVEEEQERERQAAETKRIEDEQEKEQQAAALKRIEEEQEKERHTAEAEKLEKERQAAEAKRLEKERQVAETKRIEDEQEKEQQAAALKRIEDEQEKERHVAAHTEKSEQKETELPATTTEAEKLGEEKEAFEADTTEVKRQLGVDFKKPMDISGNQEFLRKDINIAEYLRVPQTRLLVSRRKNACLGNRAPSIREPSAFLVQARDELIKSGKITDLSKSINPSPSSLATNKTDTQSRIRRQYDASFFCAVPPKIDMVSALGKQFQKFKSTKEHTEE